MNSFHYFRAIAILTIIAGHCVPISGWGESRFLERAMANIVIGGASLFVFVAGFLFHHIFYQKFYYLKFVGKRASKILIPYFVLSLIAIAYYFYRGSLPYEKYFTFSNEPGIYSSYIKPTLLYLWTGRVLVAYWFIPFAMVMTILSPLHVWLIRRPLYTQLLVFFVSLAVSMMIHRPIDNISVFHSVIYFFPVYVFGIICSVHKETIYNYLKQKELYLLLLVLLLAALQAAVYNKFGNLHKDAFEYGGIDLQVTQKLVLCLFLMVYLHRFEHINIAPLKYLASSSYALFFIHPWLLAFIPKDPVKYGVHWSWPILWPILTVSVILSTIFLAQTIKFIFKSRSKYIIGW